MVINRVISVESSEAYRDTSRQHRQTSAKSDAVIKGSGSKPTFSLEITGTVPIETSYVRQGSSRAVRAAMPKRLLDISV